MSTYPAGTLLPWGAKQLINGIDPHVWVTSPDGNSKFYILGPATAWPGITDGIVCTNWPSGMSPPFKHLDQQAARQDGTTWVDTVFDPMPITLKLEAHANTPQGLSQVVSEWIGAWNPKKPVTLEYVALDRGYWFCNPRLDKVWADPVKQSPRRRLFQPITTMIREDNAFWRSIDSTSTFQPGGDSSGFLPLSNIGDQDGWPRYLVYGPGTFTIGNGPGSPSLVTFGPILAGQIVLLTTMPRLRSVVDLSPTQPPQQLNEVQTFLETLISLVTNNNTPPLLQWFESLFGIQPPQGPLYALLNGRWTNPIPGVPQPSMAATSQIACGITGANADSKIVAALTPMRRWPE